MQVALDEGPGQPIKHQYPELSKLHHVVSQLVRCSNVTAKCQSSSEGGNPLPNPYGDVSVLPENRMPLSKEAMEYLFGKTAYIKKLIEDIHVGEEGLKLLQYCSWENPHFSRSLLIELLWQCGFAYWHDMRHHTDMLLNILLMEDTWQNHRIHNALMGVAEEREGLLETIQRTKTHYQKRAYQIIKCLVQLFKRSRCAHEMLLTNYKVSNQWSSACDWLREELDRRITSNQYNYSSWSQSTVATVSAATTNENTNGYMLERSLSAKNTLQLACELCPNEVKMDGASQITTYSSTHSFTFPTFQTSESFYVDSSDCEELPEGTLARIQSQELLDQSLDGDAIQIGDTDRKLRTVKRAPHGRNSQINKMEECLNYDPHRVQVDNYNLTDDETNDDDIDDDVDQDDDESQGHGKFEPTVKDLALSSTNVSDICKWS